MSKPESPRTHARIEFEFTGITREDLRFLHEELVELLDHHEKDRGMVIKFWRSFETILDPEGPLPPAGPSE